MTHTIAGRVAMTPADIEAIADSAIESLAWSDGHDSDCVYNGLCEPSERGDQFHCGGYIVVDSALHEQIRAEVATLALEGDGSLWAQYQAVGGTPDQFGHDMTLTRNRHGAGFWDRGLPGDLGDVLSDWARCLGTMTSWVTKSGVLMAE